MFSFHKPKIFRSSSGCCICRAKSSSSRFTDSKRYEALFERCFGLKEDRAGEICNACVLLVKRFTKLPAGSSRNWNHVVDARCGPGSKTTWKGKKVVNPDENGAEATDNFKKKHVYQRKNKRTPLTDRVVRYRNPSIDISPFLDMSFWKREKICCGTIFRAPNGEVAVDVRYISPCEPCRSSQNPVFKYLLRVREEEGLPQGDPFSYQNGQNTENPTDSHETKIAEPALRMETHDEGFYDKQAINSQCL